MGCGRSGAGGEAHLGREVGDLLLNPYPYPSFGDHGFGGGDDLFHDDHRRHSAGCGPGAREAAVADDRELPSACAVRVGGDQFRDAGDGGEALGAVQGANDGDDAIAQTGSGLEMLGAGIGFDAVEHRADWGVGVAREQRADACRDGCIFLCINRSPGDGRRTTTDDRRRAGVHTVSGQARGAGAQAGVLRDDQRQLGRVGARVERPQRISVRCADDRESREGLVGERDPPGSLGKLGAAVVGRRVRDEQSQLAHTGFQRVRAHHMVDPGGQGDHLFHPAARLRTGEVVAHAATQIHRGSYIEDFVGRAAEQVHAGARGHVGGEEPLRALARGDVGQVVDQLGEAVHALIADPGDQRVQHIDGRPRVVQRPVRRLGARTEQPGQRAQPDRRRLVPAEYPPGQLHGAQHRRGGPRGVAGGRGCAQERHVEPRVVRDEHRTGGEFEETGQHRRDAGRRVHHGSRDPGDLHDRRRHRPSGVDQGGELAEHLAAAHLDGADLGDRVGARTGPRGLQVDDDEGGVEQRRVEVVEDQLLSGGFAWRGVGHGLERRRRVRQARGSRGQASAHTKTSANVRITPCVFTSSYPGNDLERRKVTQLTSLHKTYQSLGRVEQPGRAASRSL
ncbi:hypothetical protein NONI108955_41725 [Nocardia ninae]